MTRRLDWRRFENLLKTEARFSRNPDQCRQRRSRTRGQEFDNDQRFFRHQDP
jgi:hypothetical protein